MSAAMPATVMHSSAVGGTRSIDDGGMTWVVGAYDDVGALRRPGLRVIPVVRRQLARSVLRRHSTCPRRRSQRDVHGQIESQVAAEQEPAVDDDDPIFWQVEIVGATRPIARGVPHRGQYPTRTVGTGRLEHLPA